MLIAAWGIHRAAGWRGVLFVSALLVGGAVVGAWAYSQRSEPPVMACGPAAAGKLGSVCGFNNPEDIEYVVSRNLLIISEEGPGGRLLALQPGDLDAGPRVLWPADQAATSVADHDAADCRLPDDPTQVAPHGLSVQEATGPDARTRVALVAHQFRGGLVTDAVQLFDLLGDPPELHWTRCIPYPDDVTGNDVAWLPDGSLLATNFAPRGTPAELQRAILHGAFGLNTGDVLLWTEARGWEHLDGTEGAIPNGIAVAQNGHDFYFADAGHQRIGMGTLDPRGVDPITYVAVGGAPDNLTVTARGTVLATVATLSGDVPFLCSLGGRRCRSGWAVWEVDPVARSAARVLEDDGRRLATATVALELRDRLYLGSMADDRIGVYQRTSDRLTIPER